MEHLALSRKKERSLRGPVLAVFFCVLTLISAGVLGRYRSFSSRRISLIVTAGELEVSFDRNRPATASTDFTDAGYDPADPTAIGNTLTQKLEDGDSLELCSYTLPGYRFTGWNTVPVPTSAEPGTAYADGDSSVAGAQALTLYAQWEPISYSVCFHPMFENGVARTGTSSMPAQPHTFDESQALTLNTFGMQGRSFFGWNTAEDGSGTTYSDGESVLNLTDTDGATVDLYAQWDYYIVAYLANVPEDSVSTDPLSGDVTTVEYVLSGVMPDDYFSMNETRALSENVYKITRTTTLEQTDVDPVVTVDELYFCSWNTAADGNGTEYGDAEEVSALSDIRLDRVELYAQWRQETVKYEEYTLYRKSNGGSEPTSTKKAAKNEEGLTVAVAVKSGMYERLAIPIDNLKPGSWYSICYSYSASSVPDALRGFATVIASNSDTSTFRVRPQYYHSETGAGIDSFGSVISNTRTDSATLLFYAEGATMYLTFDLAGLEDDKTHTLTLSHTSLQKVEYNTEGSYLDFRNTTAVGMERNGYAVRENYKSCFLTYADDSTLTGEINPQSGEFDKLNIPLKGLEAGKTYTLNFDFSLAHGDPSVTTRLRGNSLELGYAISQTPVTIKNNSWSFSNALVYSASQMNNSGTASEHVTMSFTATDETMYLVYHAADLSDEVAYDFRLENASLVEGSFVDFDGNRPAGASSVLSGQMYRQGIPGSGETVSLSSLAYTVPGWHCTGWNTQADGLGTAYALGAAVSIEDFPAPITLHAVWEPNALTLCYDHNSRYEDPENPGMLLTDPSYGRTVLGETAVTLGTDIPNQTVVCDGTDLFATPDSVSYVYTRGGYSFAGWSEDASATVAQYQSGGAMTLLRGDGETVTLYAVWTPHVYSVSFNGNGYTSGSMSAQSYSFGSSVLKNNAFNRTYYSFTGWNTVAAPTAENPGTAYTNGGSLLAQPASGAVVVLYAQWEPVVYTVTYNLNGGNYDGNTDNVSDPYTILDAYTVPEAPVRDGFDFSKWKTTVTNGAWGSGGEFEAGHVFAVGNRYGNPTVTAQWTGHTHTIVFDNNDAYMATLPEVPTVSRTASGSTASAAQTNGTAKTLTSNGFKRTGYSFAGWNSEPDGSGTWFTNSQSVSFIDAPKGGSYTLYAQWVPTSYTLTYAMASGSYNGSTANYPQGYTVEQSFSLIEPVRTGYSFAGWKNLSGSTVGTWVKNAVYGIDVDYGPGCYGDMTLTAQWTAQQYTVHFDSNETYLLGLDATVTTTGTMADLSYTHNTTALTSNAFAHPGYVFTGWNTAPDGSGTAYAAGAKTVSSENPGDTVTLYAQWYYSGAVTVHFDANDAYIQQILPGSVAGGSMADQTNYTYNSVVLSGNGFTRNGYTFSGWNTAADGSGTGCANASKTLKPDYLGQVITLYARWTPVSYTVTYDRKGGRLNNAEANVGQSYTIETDLTLGSSFTSAPSYTGRHLTGWKVTSAAGSWVLNTLYLPEESLGQGSYGAVTLSAQWEMNDYTVVFDANDAYMQEVKQVSEAASVASGSMEPQSFTYGTAQNLTANAFTRTGYSFAGWSTAPDGSGTSYANSVSGSSMVTAHEGTVTLYAKWTPVTYTIKQIRNTNVNNSTATATYTYDTEKALTVLAGGWAVANKTFLCWNSAADGSGEDSFDNSETVLNLADTQGAVVELYAQWGENYSLAFDGNDSYMEQSGASTASAGSMANQTGLVNGTAVTISLNADAEDSTPLITRRGYRFTGWNTAADGSGDAYAEGESFIWLKTRPEAASGLTITLYAQWEPIEYTLEFLPNGGEGSMTDQAVCYDTTDSVSSCLFSREGYSFAGWNTQANGRGIAVADGGSIPNLTVHDGGVCSLYAQWTAD